MSADDDNADDNADDNDGIAEGDDVGFERSGYGVVLDAGWSEAVVRSRHPVDGSRVFTVDATPGAPPGAVVLLHGVGNNGAVFAPIMSSLAGLGTVVAPTLSPELLTVVGDERGLMSARLIDWLSAVVAPPWRLVGHSMGGVMAGLILRTRPDLVESAVLLNAPLPGVVQRIRFRNTVDRTGRALLFMRGLAAVTRFGRPRLPWFLRGAEVAAVRVALRGFVHAPGALDSRVLRRAVLGSRTTDGNRFLALAAALPTWESEPFDRVPITILLGDADPLIPAGDVDAIVEMYPGADVHVLANCGHFVHLEWPQRSVDTICRFLTAP
jgi:pimeloyl-ACP methyl ester carboxylesterase